MAEYIWRPLGELLVQRGLIDPYDLEVALKEQKLTGLLLGELLVGKRLVSPTDLAAALAAHHGVHLDGKAATAGASEQTARPSGNGWRPLGRILVERGALTESGLQRALLAQRRLDVPLGEILVRRRWITPADLADALAEQHGIALDPDVRDSAKPLGMKEAPLERYELRPGTGKAPIFISQSYLDATDFAFELLHTSDPSALEIVRIVEDEEEECVWHYTREESEAFRAEVAKQQRRRRPLELVARDETAHRDS